MNQILEILITYWKPIVGLLFTIAGFIIALLKKKPVDCILTDIYDFAINAVNSVENSGVVGAEQKLALATMKVCDNLRQKYPTIDALEYKVLIHLIIESILSTPQKHG